MRETYLETIAMVERLHRHFLDVVKTELDVLGIQEINNVQSVILFNIGKLELTVGELTLRGCYLGSNVSYNVKKMVESGYLIQERSIHDRRSVRVRLSAKGLMLWDQLCAMHERHAQQLSQGPVKSEQLIETSKTLRRVERFWTQVIDIGQRSIPATSAA